jgi:methionyl-tRNA formyltransferase
MTHLDIIFAGSGEFGIPTLRAILDAGHKVVQVVTQPDRPAGRGQKLTPTAVAQFADARGLPLLCSTDINSEKLPPADVIVVIAFGQKIAERIVQHPRLGSINLHASRLPKFRGAAPINAAILAGESVTGNSVIRLAQKMDSGRILAQSALEVGAIETAGELHDRLATDGAPLVLSVLQALAEGTATEVEQNHAEATLAPKLSRESARIDWSRPAEQVARQIRGLYPWPGCRVKLIGRDVNELGKVTLVRARAAAPDPSDPSRIPAGDGMAVQILEVKPEGKTPMSLDAYRNGHRWEAGMRLESIL